MTPYDLQELAIQLRALKVKINTLKTIRSNLLLTLKDFEVSKYYAIIIKYIEAVIKDLENQVTILETKFLTL